MFVKKLKKASEKKDLTREKMLRQKKPQVTLDHIVKERLRYFTSAYNTDM